MDQRRLTWLALIVNAVTLAIVLTTFFRPWVGAADLPPDVSGEVSTLQGQVDALQSQLTNMASKVDRIDTAIGGDGLTKPAITKTLADLSVELTNVAASAQRAADAGDSIRTVVEHLQTQVDGLCARFSVC